MHGGAPGGGRKPAQIDGKFLDQQGGQHEIGDGNAQYGNTHAQVVKQAIMVQRSHDAQHQAGNQGNANGP